MAGLMNRVDELKARQLELPIVVLDATLPNQRLAISTSDQAFREMIEYCGVKAVEEAGDEQFGRYTARSLPVNLHAIEIKTTTSRRRLGISTPSRTLRRQHRVHGMGRPKFDFHTGRFGIVGVDRQTGSAFPFGVEAIILKASVASETCSVELKGGRRFTVDETQEEAPAGAVQPRKVTLAPDPRR